MKATLAKFQFLLLAGMALTLVNCSKGGSGGSSGSAAASCGSGTVSTAAGCLQTCGTSNGANLVVYNGVCTPATSVVGNGSNYGASCGTNMITSQYGCLPTCGSMAVMYNNQCVPVTNTNSSNSSNICSIGCGTGQVKTALGCMPQTSSCGTCYGFNNGLCYIGTAAHQYYGY